jgi:hypothetical protein
MSKKIIAITIAAAAVTMQCAAAPIEIPLGGNAYLTTADAASQERVREHGITRWTSSNAVFSAWLRTKDTGSFQLYLKYRTKENSVIKVECGGAAFVVNLAAADTIAYIGAARARDTGYIRVDMRGISRTGAEFAQASSLLVDGIARDKLNYVHNFSYYWGRRGPSVHLNYTMPENETIEYFYSEITVPHGADPVGTYYMANGFGEGYFGMQANSPSERRVLFSVWSPYKTDKPQEIPPEERVVLLAKGDSVRTGEFGNEGSGGQSFMVYPWKSGVTYGFLTRVYPDKKGNSVYSAWFYAPERGEWLLVARFLRPKTDTYYRRAHSFLESFAPDNGWRSRKAFYGNQWYRTLDGRWIEATAMRFTTDDTGRRRVRMDYKGGEENGAFFLQNCGFLNDYTAYNTHFSRKPAGKPPKVEVDKLK